MLTERRTKKMKSRPEIVQPAQQKVWSLSERKRAYAGSKDKANVKAASFWVQLKNPDIK